MGLRFAASGHKVCPRQSLLATHSFRHGSFPNLPHENKSFHKRITDAYTPAIAKVAAQRYEKDIELFGYENEVSQLL